jgi:hypothetical protein
VRLPVAGFGAAEVGEGGENTEDRGESRNPGISNGVLLNWEQAKADLLIPDCGEITTKTQ